MDGSFQSMHQTMTSRTAAEVVGAEAWAVEVTVGLAVVGQFLAREVAAQGRGRLRGLEVEEAVAGEPFYLWL